MQIPADAEVVDTTYGGVEQQMPSAADLRMASDKPIADKFLKYTNGDNTSPRQVLVNEMNRDPSKERYPGYDPQELTIPKDAEIVTPQGGIPPDAEIVQAKMTVPPDAEVVPADGKEQPYFTGDPTAEIANTVKAAGTALVDDPAGLARGLGGGAVGMAGMAQAGIQELNPFSHKPGESYDPVSMLDRIEAQGQRATNTVIDPSNQAPLGPGYKAGSELLAVPWMLTGGALSKLAKDNGFPQVSAAIELAGIYTMLAGGAHGLKSSKYKPTIEDIPKPADSAAVGAVRDFAKDPKNQFDNAATQIANLSHATDKLVGDRETYSFDDTKPIKKVVKELAATGNGKVADVLDVLADHPEVPEHLQEIARAEQQRAIDLGLDESKVTAGPHPNNNPRAAASYTPELDQVGIHQERGYEPQTLLHEIGHAIQSAAIRMYTENTAVTAVQKGITEIVGRLDEIFQKSKKDYADSLNPTERLKFDLAEQAGRHVGDTRGFHNLQEFATEVRVNPKFQEILKQQRVTDPAVIRRLAPEWKSPIKNMWAVAHRVLNSIIAPDRIVNQGHSQFDLALSNVMQLTERMTPEVRTSKNLTGESKRGAERVNQRVAGRTALERYKLVEPMQRISALLQAATTKSEFRDRLAVEFGHPDWANYVAKYTDRLWNNKQQVIDAAGANRSYQKLSPADRLMTADPRTIDDFFKQEFGDRTEPLNKGEDISGLGTMVMGAASVALHKGAQGIAGALTKFVVNKVSENRALNSKLHAVVMQHFQPFKKLKFSLQDHVMQEAIYWDGEGRKHLETLGLQWPQESMLAERGMKPEEIKAYQGLTEGVDYLYRLLNQSLAKIGQPPVRQIPGYMPHIFKGDYKVLVRLTDLRDPTNPKVVAVKGYQTVYGANAYIKALNAGKHDMPGFELRPELDPDTKKPYRVIKLREMHDDLVSSVQEHTTAYENVSQLDPGIIKWMESIDASSMRGFTKHVLEQTGVHGYLGDPFHPGKTKQLMDRLGVNLEKKPLRSLYENYAKSVVDHYTNTIFQTEVIHPLLDHVPEPYEHGTTFGSMLENTTELTSYIRRLGYNVTGQPLNHAWIIDKFMRDVSVGVGLSPRLYRDTLSSVRNIFTAFALRFNLGFLAGNAVQSAHVIGLLELANVMRRKDGLKNSPSALASYAKAMVNWAHSDPATLAAVQWAKDNHILDPLLDADIQKQRPKNWLHQQTRRVEMNPHIESFSRQAAFRAAYEHFRQIYIGDEMAARRAAENTMKMTMVDYDRSSRPLMFQQTGSAGEFLSPFQVYRNQYLSNFAKMAELIKSDPTNLHMYRPFLMSSAIIFLMAGAVGAPLAAEYGALQQLVDKLFPDWNWPTLQEALGKMHVPNWTTIGTLSSLTEHLPFFDHGIYIGSSVNAIDTTQGMFAQAQWLDALKDLAVAGTRYVGHAIAPNTIAPVTRGDIYGPARQAMPAIAKTVWDKMNQPPGTDITSKSTTLEGAYHRTPADEHATWLGKRSNVEFQERTANQIVESNSKARQQEIKRWVQAGADMSLGYEVQGNIAEVMQGLAKFEIDEAKAREMIFKEVQSRYLTPAQRDVQSNTPESRRRVLDRKSLER